MAGYVATLIFCAVVVLIGCLCTWAVEKRGEKLGCGVVTAFFGLLLIGGIVGGPHWTEKPAGSHASTDTSSSDSDPIGSESNPAPKTLTIDGLKYTIVAEDTTDTVATVGGSAAANGEFVAIDLRVTNVGDKPATVSSTDFHLHRDGKVYDESPTVMDLGDAFEVTEINPGISQNGSLLFDVPEGTNRSSYVLEVFGNDGTTPAYLAL